MYEEEIHFEKLLLKQSEMVLEHLTLVTLTFNPVTPKSLGFLCYPGWTCGPRLIRVVNGISELLIRNEKIKDGLTDRRTNMCKAICPALSSSKGGHKQSNNISNFMKKSNAKK